VRKSLPVASALRDLARHLSLDAAREVRAFVLGLFERAPSQEVGWRSSSYATFSRPPPPAPGGRVDERRRLAGVAEPLLQGNGAALSEEATSGFVDDRGVRGGSGGSLHGVPG
jgi:hypothetical protein